MRLWNLNKRVLIITLVSLLLVGLAAATVVNYVSNKMTATAIVQSECNDGVDNDIGDGFDSGDPHCHTDGDISNPLSYNVCRSEDGLITNCI